MTADREAKCRSNNAAPIKVAPPPITIPYAFTIAGDIRNIPSNVTMVKSIEQLADEVIAGKHGTGEARRKALGAQFAAVQALVNEKLGAAKPKTVAQLSATFTLPLDDPKNALCTPFNFVELYDNGERVDLYRIMPKATEKSESTETITYNCEHVLATLIDDSKSVRILYKG